MLNSKGHSVCHPCWQLFRDGCSGGESANDVGVRTDRVEALDSRDLKYPKVSASKLKELATAKRTIGHEMMRMGILVKALRNHRPGSG